MTTYLDKDALTKSLNLTILDTRKEANKKKDGSMTRYGLLVYSDAVEHVLSLILLGKFDIDSDGE